jgi:GntR family transcriptional regulator / MocR family aminotransferase
VASRTTPPDAAPPGSATAPLSLRGGLVDASDFPRANWSEHLRAVIDEEPAAAFGYPAPEGVAALRTSLAVYLARTRGVRASDGDLVVGSGFADLLALVCAAIRARGGRRVAVERYGHDIHRRTIAASGLEVVPIDVDDDGADVAHLTALPDIAAVLLTPAHQFPTGVPLSSDRRTAVVDWAHRTDALILEDDYDGEFRFDRRSIGALQSLSPEHVVYLGTASKALAPGIGIAWTVAPASVRSAMVDRRVLTGGAPSGLHQHTLARFLDAFDYDRAVRTRRAAFRRRRDRLAERLDARAPAASIHGLAAGLQCLVRLPDARSEKGVVDLAAQRGIAVEGLSAYDAAPSSVGDAMCGVVVGYGAPAPVSADAALDAIVDVIAAVLEDPRHA